MFVFEPSPCTVCPRSSDTFYMVTYYIKWVTTSWIDGISTNRTAKMHPYMYTYCMSKKYHPILLATPCIKVDKPS